MLICCSHCLTHSQSVQRLQQPSHVTALLQTKRYCQLQAANSNLVWKQLYTQRWGTFVDPIDTCIQSIESNAVQEEKQAWHARYKSRHMAEYAMQCPACEQSKIIPIVYGFPSHLLVRNMRANKLRMGNDHLIEGQPVWICSLCSQEFLDFPYISVEIAQQ